MFYNVYVSAYDIGLHVKNNLEYKPQILCRPGWLPLGYINFGPHTDYRFLLRRMKHD